MTLLMNERISSLYVCPGPGHRENPPASETGIITERDVLRALATYGATALQMPVEQLMSKPLAVVPRIHSSIAPLAE